MERLCLVMMFMEIISLEIIVGHKERRDGDINHAIVTHKAIPYRLLKMDAVLCFLYQTNTRKLKFIYFSPLGSSIQCCFVSQVFFFSQVVWTAEEKANSKAPP